MTKHTIRYLFLLSIILFVGCNQAPVADAIKTKYTIKKGDGFHYFFYVTLPERITTEDLKKLNTHLTDSVGDNDIAHYKYEINVAYFLDADTNQWAAGQLNPVDSIIILGLSKEFLDRQLDRANKDNRDIVGTWLEKRGNFSQTLFVSKGKYYIEQTILDSFLSNSAISKSDTIQVIVEKEKAYWIIDYANRKDPRLAGNESDLVKFKIDSIGNLSFYDPPNPLTNAIFIYEKLKYIPGKLK